MSTYYASLKTIQMADLFDSRMERFDIREEQSKDSSPERRVLTDGFNFVWVYGKEGIVQGFTRYAPNGNPAFIFECICKVFDTNIVSEYEPEYWGYESQEEMDAMFEAVHRKCNEQFYGELVKFIDGQPCDIKPGTIGREQAEIAKKLVAQNPALALTENRDTLLAQIDDIYKLVHPSVVVKLDESELDALARRLQTLEELPRLALEVKRNPMNLLDKIINPED